MIFLDKDTHMNTTTKGTYDTGQAPTMLLSL